MKSNIVMCFLLVFQIFNAARCCFSSVAERKALVKELRDIYGSQYDYEAIHPKK